MGKNKWGAEPGSVRDKDRGFSRIPQDVATPPPLPPKAAKEVPPELPKKRARKWPI